MQTKTSSEARDAPYQHTSRLGSLPFAGALEEDSRVRTLIDAYTIASVSDLSTVIELVNAYAKFVLCR